MTKTPTNDKNKSKLIGVRHLPTQFYVHKKFLLVGEPGPNWKWAFRSPLATEKVWQWIIDL